MNWWQAVVLGLVEGITEYLPVSSTGHLIIAGDLMRLGQTEASKAALDAFNVGVQGGAILAVLGLYWPRFVQMLNGLLGKDAAGLRLFINLIIAFIPAAVLGLALKKTIEHYLFSLWPVVGALVVGGVFMIIIDWLVIRPRLAKPADAQAPEHGAAVTDLTPRGAALVGVLQCFALWPGTSRSMMTITGGVLAGLRPAAAAEFSFLLGMPTLLAASVYSLFKHFRSTPADANMVAVFGWPALIIALVVATVSAALAVKWLVGFLNRYGLTPFGIYRILLGVVLAVLVLQGLVTVD